MALVSLLLLIHFLHSRCRDGLRGADDWRSAQTGLAARETNPKVQIDE